MEHYGTLTKSKIIKRIKEDTDPYPFLKYLQFYIQDAFVFSSEKEYQFVLGYRIKEVIGSEYKNLVYNYTYTEQRFSLYDGCRIYSNLILLSKLLLPEIVLKIWDLRLQLFFLWELIYYY